MRLMNVLLLAVFAAALVGCGASQDEPACPVDAATALHSDDWLVLLSPESFARVSGGSGEPEPVLMREGSVILQQAVPECEPLPQAPCDVHWNTFRFQLTDFRVGDFRIEQFRLGFEEPLVLTDYGAGVDVPSTLALDACASINGTAMVADEVTQTSITMYTNASSQQLTLRGEVDAWFDFKSTELTRGWALIPVTITLELSIRASGERPWQAG
jgi:hypothetical protein